MSSCLIPSASRRQRHRIYSSYFKPFYFYSDFVKLIHRIWFMQRRDEHPTVPDEKHRLLFKIHDIYVDDSAEARS